MAIQVKPTLDIMLCGLHTGVFFLVLPCDIDTVSPIIFVVTIRLLGCVVDDAPADEVNIGGLFIEDFVPHFIGAVADLPYPVFVLFFAIGYVTFEYFPVTVITLISSVAYIQPYPLVNAVLE